MNVTQLRKVRLHALAIQRRTVVALPLFFDPAPSLRVQRDPPRVETELDASGGAAHAPGSVLCDRQALRGDGHERHRTTSVLLITALPRDAGEALRVQGLKVVPSTPARRGEMTLVQIRVARSVLYTPTHMARTRTTSSAEDAFDQEA